MSPPLVVVGSCTLSMLNVGMALQRHPAPVNYLRKRIPQMKKQMLALAATSTTVLGLMATGAMGTTTAFANGGGTGNNTCTNYFSLKLVECVGQVNGNTVKVDISALNDIELNILSGNELTVVAKDIDVIEATTGDVTVIAAKVGDVLSGLHVNACDIQVVNVQLLTKATSTCHA
jgi:outer membrane lipoprotein SlyB